VNPDFKDLLSEFSARGVEFLLVGAHALAVHGHVRATKNLDVWVCPDPVNAKRVLDALASFGAPLEDLSDQDLARPGTIFQIGVPPLRIDVITAIDGVEFPDAWRDRVEVLVSGLVVPVLSRHHLIANKHASGRLQDLADIERLEQMAAEERRPESGTPDPRA
jgi:hypothetical protein